MSLSDLHGPSDSGEKKAPLTEPFIMPVMNRDLEEVVYKQQGKYPNYSDKEAMAEYYSKVCLRRMPTKCCGILELHGVQTLFGVPGGLEKAVEAARAAGYSDAASNLEEAVNGSSYGPSGLLIASINEAKPEWIEAMEKVGFSIYQRFYNTIWDRAGSGKVNECVLFGLVLNEKARTGEGNWREELFFKQRAARKKVA